MLDYVDGQSHSFPSSLDFLPEDSIFDCNVQILRGLLSMTRRAAFSLYYTVMEPLPSRTRCANRKLDVKFLTALWGEPAIEDRRKSTRASTSR